MEQSISEVAPSSSIITQQCQEAETKKRPYSTVDESHPDDISSGNGICLDGKENVQPVQEMLSSHESPRKKRHHCNSSADAPDCVDESESAVSDANTQADEVSFAIKEASLQTCETEKFETIDMELDKPVMFTEDDRKPITEVTLIRSADASLLSGSTESIIATEGEHDFQKDEHPVDLLKEGNIFKVNNVTDDAPAPVLSETSQSTATCQDGKTSGSSSERKDVEAAEQRRKKLLILDVNGLLADIVAYPERQYMPDAWISMKAVFKRPFCTDFLEFCFENFEVGVWSSRNRKNVDIAVDFLMGDKKNKLLFCWDQSHCTDTGYRTLEDRNKPLFLKEIKKLWDKEDPNLPWEKGDYNESNTILMDDSPHKALGNPLFTGVFPYPYGYKDIRDNLLARKGKLRLYLERLLKADNVQKFVAENRFGQRHITKLNPSWPYYSKIFDAANSRKPENKCIAHRAGEPINGDKHEPHSEASTSEIVTSVATAEDLTTSVVKTEELTTEDCTV